MEEIMEKLRGVNQSLGLEAAEGARNQLENPLENLHAALHADGQSPNAVSTCILHGSCLVLVALLVPTPPRAILFLLAFSVLGELLGIPVLSALLVLAVAGRFLVVAAHHRGAGGAWPVLPGKDPHPQLTSTPERECKMELLQEELERMEMSCLQEPSCLDTPCLAGCASPVPGGWRTKLSSCGVTLEPTTGAGKRWEPCSPSQSLASNMSSLSPRLPCQGVTKAGKRCRKKAILGQDFCHIHATGRAWRSSSAMDSSPHI